MVKSITKYVALDGKEFSVYCVVLAAQLVDLCISLSGTE